ncbi:MAG: hypothetical protein RXR82_05290, partial [Nitrososphaeria archaeon]
IEYFNSYGIEVVTGASGRVLDVVEAFVKGTLSTDSSWRARGDFGHEHEHGEDRGLHPGRHGTAHS